MTAEATLETVRASVILSGAIDGKNAETRDAQTRQACAAQYTELASAKQLETLSRAEFDMCRYELARINDLLRLMEIGSGVNGNGETDSGGGAAEALRDAMNGAVQAQH